MVKVVGIRFRNAGKIYYFGPGKLQLKAGIHAIVETARGVEMGTVMTLSLIHIYNLSNDVN